MRRQRGLVGLTGLAALVGLGVVAKPAMSAVTTEKSASILVFPKVIANGNRDTIIQITNTSNSVQHLHCFYIDGQPGSSGAPLCLETDFDIWLTKQQPTHWVVSKGRQVSFEGSCAAYLCNPTTTGGPVANCCDAGFDPGRIPPVGPGFTGELLCVLTDAGDSPYPGNAIKGEATIEDQVTSATTPALYRAADITKYNAIGFIGYNTNDGNSTLCLGPDGATSAGCSSREYEACPAAWYLDHAARGAVDAVEPDTYSIQPNVTVVPCTLNLETQAPTSVTLQFDVITEFETHLSASTTVTCWASWDLGLLKDDGSVAANGVSDIFNAPTAGGSILQTRVRSATGTPRGVLMVVEETHLDGDKDHTAKSAQNGHTSFADQSGMDVLTIPSDQFQSQP